jgi:hypothetical protein
MISPTQVKKTTCGIHYQASEIFSYHPKEKEHQQFTKGSLKYGQFRGQALPGVK